MIGGSWKCTVSNHESQQHTNSKKKEKKENRLAPTSLVLQNQSS